MTRSRKQAEAERLEDAYTEYQHRLAILRGIEQCRSWAPDGDTRCQLVHDHRCTTEGHDLPCQHSPDCGGLHRHRPQGFTVGVITW